MLNFKNIKWGKEQHNRAKDEKRCLIALAVFGKYARRDGYEFAGMATEEEVKIIDQAFLAICEIRSGKAILKWKDVITETGADSQQAQLGTKKDGVLFTLNYLSTCYRRGKYCLVIEICGENHHRWGCFDYVDQPICYYSEVNAKNEAEAIAKVLKADRADHFTCFRKGGGVL